MAKKKVNKKVERPKKDESKVRAFVAVFFSIVGFLIALILWRKDKYTMFYASESLVLFIGFLIVSAIGWIPIIGWVLWIFVILLWVITWIYALQGEQKKTWVIGDLAEKINL